MKKRTLKFTALFLCFASFSAFTQQTVDIEIRGIKGTRAIRNTELNVLMINPEEMDGSERYQQLVAKAVDRGLRVFGYYNSSVSFELKKRTNQRDLLIANVTPGEPTKIAGIDIQIEGDATKDENFVELRKQLPKVGELVEHQAYDNYKSNITRLALSRGYFDGVFRVARLEISPETFQAWWKMNFDSGKRYHYGLIKFINSQIREDYLQNMLKFKSGDPYLTRDISTLTNDFSSMNWFSSVLVQPNVDKNDKAVDLDILLYPRKKNAMEIGAGFTTDTGPHLQISWSKPWINSRGHSFKTNLYVSSSKQTLEASYRIPLKKNPLDYYYEVAIGGENEQQNDTNTRTATLSGLRYWNRDKGWQYFAGVRMRYDSFRQADFEDKTFLLYPAAGLSRSRLRGGLFPTWGDAQKLTVEMGNKLWKSEVNFMKAQVSSSWIRTYGENHRFVFRGEVGYLKTKDIRKIPPSLRFFAGGDRSVRGYGYKKISPRTPDNKLVGGSRLLTTSLEYQYQVQPNWWVATFVDAGMAANSFSTKELRYGAGVGVRWASPVGAIKFDIATPIRDKDKSKNIQFYIGLGTEI